MEPRLLTRDSFRETVFSRDNHKCVVCQNAGQDAHHILERRLFHDGGYYVENGATLCGECHIKAEQTVLSVEDIRIAAGILKPVIPEHLYEDQVYTKWGDPVMENGKRARGELFHDESVQKILASGDVLHLYTSYIKYPRTYHVPWSRNITKDDKVHRNMGFFEGKEVVVTVKMDGENTTLYSDYIHARSLDSRNHASRNWVKNFWGSMRFDIPDGFRVCGENLYAEHSIGYDSLESYFYGFSVWDDMNRCLSWDDTMEWFQLLNIVPVPVIYEGIYDEERLLEITDELDPKVHEGYVLRTKEGFSYQAFSTNVAKFVRKDHVMTTKHWMTGQPIKPNKLKS